MRDREITCPALPRKALRYVDLISPGAISSHTAVTEIQPPNRCNARPDTVPRVRQSLSRRLFHLARDLFSDIPHGGGEVVLGLQIDPEQRVVAEIAADPPLAVENVDDAARGHAPRRRPRVGGKLAGLNLAPQDATGVDWNHERTPQ